MMTVKYLDKLPTFPYEEAILDIIAALETSESKVAEMTYDDDFFCGESEDRVIRKLLERVGKYYDIGVTYRPGKIYFKKLKG